MSDRMQTMQHLQTIKSSTFRKNMTKQHEFMSLSQSFVHEVTKDQAASVFLTANARLLVKAKILN